MKKIIGILAIIMLIMTSVTVHAEDEIQLIAGLKFGMDKDRAVSISKYELCVEPVAWQVSFLKNIMGLSNTDYVAGFGEIGGYESTVVGTFDEFGQLKQVIYFANNESNKQHNNPHTGWFYEDNTRLLAETYGTYYEQSEAALSQRYGKGNGKDDAIDFSVRLTTYSDNITFYNSTSHQYIAHKYSQRVVNQPDNTTVVIEHAVVERILTSGEVDSQFAHMVIYTYYDFPVGQEEHSNSIGF